MKRNARLALTSLLTISACAPSYPLMISTDPPDAEVDVNQQTRSKRVAPPYVMLFDPEVPTQLGVHPSGLDKDQYEPKYMKLSLSSYLALPLEPDGMTRKLHVRLDPIKRPEEDLYVELTYVEVVLDADRSWRGLISQSRSFKEITEVGGMTPTRLVSLDSRLGITGLALSPDGKGLVFSQASWAVDVPEKMTTLPVGDHRLIPLKGCNLRGISIDAGGIQQISSEDFLDMFPSFAPSGDGLLFSSNRRRPKLSDILRINYPRKTGISNIYINPDEAMAFKPTMASDGTIAFVVYPDDESDPQVWTTGGRFEFPTQITKGVEPAISPDGKRIAYIGLDGNLWVTDSDGSNQIQLTSGAGRIIQSYGESLTRKEREVFDWTTNKHIRPIHPYSYPSWSAGGEFIVYSGMEGNDSSGRPNEDIWMMTYDGQKRRQLTTNGSADRLPLLSPDGRFIYFLSNRGKAWAIWRIETPPIE